MTPATVTLCRSMSTACTDATKPLEESDRVTVLTHPALVEVKLNSPVLFSGGGGGGGGRNLMS